MRIPGKSLLDVATCCTLQPHQALGRAASSGMLRKSKLLWYSRIPHREGPILRVKTRIGTSASVGVIVQDAQAPQINGATMESGASFYINATEPPYSKHYNMYDHVVKELPEAIIALDLPIVSLNLHTSCIIDASNTTGPITKFYIRTFNGWTWRIGLIPPEPR